MTITQLAPLPLEHLRRGKVREVYVVDDDRLLLVATDRVSAFDVVMARSDSVQGRGAHADHGVVAAAARARCHASHARRRTSTRSSRRFRRSPSTARALAGRAMLCRRTEVFPIECVIRGYLSGSAWKEYRASGTLAGESLPPGLRESDRLDPPLFSPATKAEIGARREHHDRARASRTLGRGRRRGARAAEPSRVRAAGATSPAERGIIIADTKFEFGRDRDGEIMLIDEVLTPDSSRFWPAEQYEPGRVAAELRQAAAARLSRRRATRRPLERRCAAAAASRGGRATRRARAISTRSGASPAPSSIVTELIMNFAREGLSFIVDRGAHRRRRRSASRSARRSWPLWLLAFALTRHRALGRVFLPRSASARGERGERLVISPADGKVVMITEVDEPTFMKRRARSRISIFMNVFNVHVNRYPVSGTCDIVDRQAGQVPQRRRRGRRASRTSRRRSASRRDRERILVRQIAGLIARRIVTDSEGGRHSRAGRAHGHHSLRVARRRVPARRHRDVRVKVGDAHVRRRDRPRGARRQR